MIICEKSKLPSKLAEFFSLALVFIGIIVLSGWILHLKLLIRIDVSYTPMMFNTALVFMLLGLSTYAYLKNCLRLALTINSFVFILCLMTLFQYIFPVNFHIDQLFLKSDINTDAINPGRMALNTVICFLSGSITLYLIYLTSFKNKYPLFFSTLLSISIFSIGMSGSIGYFYELNAAYSWGISSMALLTSIGMMIFSICSILIIFIKSHKHHIEIINFTPALVSYITLFITALLYLAVTAQQTKNINQLSESEINNISKLISVHIKDRALALQRMSDRFESNPKMKESDWQRDALNYIHDQIGYEKIEYIDSSFKIKWIAPYAKNQHLINFNIKNVPSIQEFLKTALTKKSILLSPIINLVNAEKNLLLFSPIKKNNQVNGFFIGIINSNILLKELLKRSEGGYFGFSIYTNKNILYHYKSTSHPLKNASDQIKKIDLYGQQWKIVLWPTTKILAFTKSNLPNYLLFFGIFLSFIFGTLIHVIIMLRKNYILINMMQRDLTSAKDSLEGIISGIQASVIAIDQKYNIIALNASFKKFFLAIFGVKPHKGMNLNTILTTEHQESALFLQLWKKTLNGEVFTITEYINNDKKNFPVEIRSSSIYDCNNNLIGGCHIITDITERINSEKILKNTKYELEAGINNLNIYNKSILALNKITALFQSSMQIDEILQPVKHYCEDVLLIPNGQLFLYNSDNAYYVKELSWGISCNNENKIFEKNDCWALRLSKTHIVEKHDNGFICKHTLKSHLPEFYTTACFPLQCQGNVLGLLHIYFPEKDFKNTNHKFMLLEMLSEQLSMSIMNQKLKNDLRLLSIQDSLTGAYNRRYFEEAFSQILARYKREKNKKPFSIAILDIDFFKNINDKYGHIVGDMVLKKVANTLYANVRQADIVCRWGGEEFVIYFNNTDIKIALNKIEIIREKIKGIEFSPDKNKKHFHVTVSIGVTSIVNEYNSLEKLIEIADKALYMAKNTGRNKCYKLLPE